MIGSDGVLPFGVTLLISGWYDGKQTLFQCDPSVAYFVWKAIVIELRFKRGQFLAQIQDLLVEKELKLHITPEEFEMLREDFPVESKVIRNHTVEEVKNLSANYLRVNDS
uniref:Uncharacterized protein n=1 Tax=Rhodnius prolixus TaxID=13249 RepID=T1HWU0_RHOPR